jgi:hypothetical protein
MIRRALFSSLLLAVCSFSPLSAQVEMKHTADRIIVNIDGQPFTEFFIGAAYNKPYLHPLRSASQKIVTRRFPMEMVEGEVRDHPHHRGLWFAHGDVNGLDYWSSDSAYKKDQPRIVIRRIGELKGGRRNGTMHTTFDWLDLKLKPVLTESRITKFYARTPGQRVFDLDITLIAVQPSKFGDTKEGTFAIRVAPQMEVPGGKHPPSPPRTGKMVSSEGKTDGQIWGTRAPWVTYSGDIEGEPLAITVFDHPTNPRHPTYWHARTYGLFAANIFGLHDFLNDKSQDGSLTLQPGQSLRFRYRVVIHPAAGFNAPEELRKYSRIK